MHDPQMNTFSFEDENNRKTKNKGSSQRTDEDQYFHPLSISDQI